MKPVPITKNALVLRTDFSDQTVWERIHATILSPVDGFYAYVNFVDDADFDSLSKDQILALIPLNYPHTFIILVDWEAAARDDHALLVVDLSDKPGREFRAVPDQIQGIENNLSIANMDFAEFADAVDDSGVFRGFPKS